MRGVVDVETWVTNKEMLTKLREDEKSGSNRLIFEGGQFHFIPPPVSGMPPPKAKLLSGLTTTLARHMWPLDTKGGLIRAKGPKRKSANRPPRRRGAVASDFLTGFARGSFIHRQIEQLFTLDQTTFRQFNRDGADPLTKALAEFILSHGWIPVKCEFGVYEVKLKLATKIDMVCVTKEGKLIFLEIKTGYSGGTYTQCEGYFRGPLRNVMPSSAKTKAIVQIVCGAMMAIRRHRLPLEKTECWVIRVDDNVLDADKVSNEFIKKHGPSILGYLNECQNGGR